MNRNIILCGVGGQGTVLASRLISAAAMKEGIPVQSAETIGMAQRGGSVFSHIRLGEGVNTPMIGLGQADLILGFELGETVRQLPYLKEGGKVFYYERECPNSSVITAINGNYVICIEALENDFRNNKKTVETAPKFTLGNAPLHKYGVQTETKQTK